MSKRKPRDPDGSPPLGAIRPLKNENKDHTRVFGYEQRRDTWKSIALPRAEEKKTKIKKWNGNSQSVSDRRLTDQLNRLAQTLPPNVFYSIMPLYCLSKQFAQAARVEFVWPKNPRQPLVVRVWKGPRDDINKQVISQEMTMCPLTLNQ
jgi:hypothetical protein